MSFSINYFIQPVRDLWAFCKPTSLMGSYVVTHLPSKKSLQYGGLATISLGILYMIYRLLSKKKPPVRPEVPKKITITPTTPRDRPTTSVPLPITMPPLSVTPTPVTTPTTTTPLNTSLVDSFVFVSQAPPQRGVPLGRLVTVSPLVNTLLAYQHFLYQLQTLAGPVPKFILTNDPQTEKAWTELTKNFTCQPLQSAEQQYYNFVIALRNAVDIFRQKSTDCRTEWILSIAYHRFNSVIFSPYCKNLVLHLTGDQFPVLSLDNFLEEFNRRNNLLHKLAPKDIASTLKREGGKGQGTMNVLFDPLAKNNIPYKNEQIILKGRDIQVLRHGVPIYHNDPSGFFAGGVDKLTSYIPFISVPKFKPLVTNPPVITSDYSAFVTEAAKKRQNIGHVIFENNEEDVAVGDERARVEVRLGLERNHLNFFPLALPLEGHFFSQQHFKAGTIDTLINNVATAMKENKSGFQIPEKVQQTLKNTTNIKKLLAEVKTLYFPASSTIDSFEDQQAFILFSYAHVILYFCQEAHISILEMICKDDLDRGGAMKIILKLHLLYMTQQITSENLENILINALAAPWITKKQGIIVKKSIFVNVAGNRMKKAFPLTYQLEAPRSTLLQLQNSSYRVLEVPSQSIFPDCSTAPTQEIYREYFSHYLTGLFSFFSGNYIEHFVAYHLNRCQATKIDATTVNGKIDTIAPSLEMVCGINCIKTELPKDIRTYLEENKIHNEAALKVMNLIQQDVFEDIEKALKNTFENSQLGITFSCQPKKRVELTVNNGIARLTMTVYFTMTASRVVSATVTIDDHRTGQAYITLSEPT